MPAMEPLCQLICIKSTILSKEENLFLEADLFTRICDEIKEILRIQHKEFFRLIKSDTEMENEMLENYFIRLIIRDIISTEDYTLEGIARYTDTPEEVVEEVFAGRNTSPSATFLRRLIELHRNLRRSLYNAIMKKITSEYSTT